MINSYFLVIWKQYNSKKKNKKQEEGENMGGGVRLLFVIQLEVKGYYLDKLRGKYKGYLIGER